MPSSTLYNRIYPAYESRAEDHWIPACAGKTTRVVGDVGV